MRLTAQEVYDKLINEDQILQLKGQIRFYLGDVDIVVKQRDVVGNIIQEWLQGWLDKRGIEYALNDNSQMPPDFFLNPDDETTGLLEVKAFNRNASPGFDIADFRMYEEEIQKKPYMLHVDYLIFGYDMSDDGVVTIKDLWLKKVWEITRAMNDWPINLQVKKNVVQKIRPGVWYTEKGRIMFESMEDFIAAIDQTVWQNPATRRDSGTWMARFLRYYEEFYKIKLNVPRWDDIKDKYQGQ
ncbi:MAG: NgoBV family restriction endonuclease [Butyrivibrio sp.]|nr:NgoBV family restriction endonuclease [Butyrivibrio sp.]